MLNYPLIPQNHRIHIDKTAFFISSLSCTNEYGAYSPYNDFLIKFISPQPQAPFNYTTYMLIIFSTFYPEAFQQSLFTYMFLTFSATY